MLKSYRGIVGYTLVVGFLGGTFVYAKSAELQQQVSKRNRDNTTALTFGSHAVGPFYAGKKSYGLTDRAENNLSSAPPLTLSGYDPIKTVPPLRFSDFEVWAQNAR